MRHVHSIVHFFMVVLFLLAGVVPAQAQQGPGAGQNEKAENLKVLPEDMPLPDVRRVMMGFTRALGVRCLYCHVGEEGKPPSTFDFPSDEKELKETSRVMMRMVHSINTDFIATTAGDTEKLNVTCETCHRGVARPQLLEDLLADVVAEKGVEEAVAEYHRLKERYHGGFSYNFQEPTLVRLGQQLLDAEQPDAALRFLMLNAELFPESSQTYATAAEAYVAKNDTPAAIQNVEKALALNPNNNRLKEWLEELKNP
jgi:predicted negative regulator of RcsB-dependent stress response